MPDFALTPAETRVLGCLLEKERTTPENYPLSLHALTAASNQTTNRDPVTAYDERTIENAVNALREKKLATVIFGAGARVQKYRHNLLDHFELNARDVALLCVLLLRGPQTPGELRARAERMGAFTNVEQVQACLDDLARGDSPLVHLLPARPGQKERRYVEVLSGPAADREAEMDAPPPMRAVPEPAGGRFEEEIAALRGELAALREEFAAFRKQFE